MRNSCQIRQIAQLLQSSADTPFSSEEAFSRCQGISVQPFVSFRLLQPLRRLLAERPDLLSRLQQRYHISFNTQDYDKKLAGLELDLLFDELATEGFRYICFELASETEIGSFGVFDYYLHSCDTLGQALSEFHRFHEIIFQDVPSIEIKLIKDGLSIAIHERYADGRLINRHRANLIYAVLINLIRLLTGQSNLVPLYCDSNGQPLSEETHRYVSKWLSPDIRFNCEVPRVVYPAALWSLRLRNANPRLKSILLDEVRAEHGRHISETSLSQQIADAINYIGLNRATLESVSAKLELSESSIKRKLKQENLTFSDMLNTTRQRQAMHRLCETEDKIDLVALDCGFGERTSFERAFRQWFGVSPAQFRDEARAVMSQQSLIKRRLDQLPSLSPYRAEQLRYLGSAEQPTELRHVIEQDPILIAKLLVQANSPSYGAGQVFSIQEALSKFIDPELCRQTVLGVVAVDAVSKHENPETLRSFWVRSFALIYMLQTIKPIMPLLADQDMSYLATIAMLRNIGLVLVSDIQANSASNELAGSSLSALLDQERSAWGYSRYQLAFYVLTQWGLPPALTLAIKAFDPVEIASSPFPDIQSLLNQLNAFIELWFLNDVTPEVFTQWRDDLEKTTGLPTVDVQQLAILTMAHFLTLEKQASALV